MADLPPADPPVASESTLAAAYDAITALVTPLNDADFARPTRCAGLSVGPLLIHVLFDAQRALMAFATPAAPPSDRDFVSCWRDFPVQRRTERTACRVRSVGPFRPAGRGGVRPPVGRSRPALA